MTILQHRHSSAVLSTEVAHSRRFHFCHKLISSVSQDHTYQSLFSAFWITVTHVSYFCLAFCIFLPHSVIFQILLFVDIKISNSTLCTTPDKPSLFSLAYFCSSLSLYLRKQTLLFHCFLNKDILIAFSSKRSKSWLTKTPDSVTLVTVCKLTSCLLAAAQNFT